MKGNIGCLTIATEFGLLGLGYTIDNIITYFKGKGKTYTEDLWEAYIDLNNPVK